MSTSVRWTGARRQNPLHIRMLGPVDIIADGTPVGLAGLRRKTMLAALALRIGQPVASDLLIDVVWPGNAPATVVNTLQSHISYLRRTLGYPGSIVAVSPGYRLDPHQVGTDLQAAARLIDEAGQTPNLSAKASLLQDALDMWRGRPLDDLRGHPWIDEQADRLEGLQYSVAKSLAGTRLELGEHAATIPVLEGYAERYPFDEELCGQLILALYRAGRQADALAVFRRLRTRLAIELGIDPSKTLRDLEQAVLQQSDSLDLLPGQVHGRSTLGIPASQLPPVGTILVDRAEEIAFLNESMTSSPRSATVLVVSGAPGVGKSTLALHWAHQIAPQFPDGQLYVDLRGYDVQQPEVGTGEVLRHLAVALGVIPSHLPAEANALSGLVRSLLVGKRMLIVLDNARDCSQIRAVLPSDAGSLALVTSRSDMTPLAVTSGARLLRLAPLSAAGGRELLAGHFQEAESPDAGWAVDHILRKCGGLPLALAIVCSRRTIPGYQGLAQIAAQMITPKEVLDVMDGGDPATDLRSVCYASYRLLSSTAAVLLQHLAGLDTTEIRFANASLCSRFSESGFRRALNELVLQNLLKLSTSGHYTMPPLLRAYANELATSAEAATAALTG